MEQEIYFAGFFLLCTQFGRSLVDAGKLASLASLNW
jgi:hypothetical protein